jgi:enamine deaminase RidA (YjgF/YER057c/UK114 family)
MNERRPSLSTPAASCSSFRGKSRAAARLTDQALRAIKATIFVTDIARANEVRAVRARWYGTAAPASTLVAVHALSDPSWLERRSGW